VRDKTEQWGTNKWQGKSDVTSKKTLTIKSAGICSEKQRLIAMVQPGMSHLYTHKVKHLFKVSSRTSGVEHTTEGSLKWRKLDTEFTDLGSLKLLTEGKLYNQEH
jgi:hypothetical protein